MRLARRTAATAAVLALSLAACGGDAADDADVAAEDAMDDMDDMADDAMDDMDDMADDAMDDMEDMGDEAMDDMEDMGDDMDMGDMDMDMGSADGVRADEVEDPTELRSADFVLLDGAPAGFEDAAGTAYVAFTDVTTATIDLTGLEPGTQIVAHLHADTCANNGGPHFMFDPDGPATPPNEVHLLGTADDDGAVTVSVQNDQLATDAMAMVFHATDGDTTKVACADLPAA